MREIRTEIEINAPPIKVWSILTDFDSWKDWNPIVKNASGVASLGSKLNISMCGKEGKDGPNYMPVITNFDQPKYFCWRAKMMAGFMFTNDKVFKTEETSSGTRLVHTEAYSGVLVPMFWSKLNRFVPSMLNSMNEALKSKVEKS